MQINILGWDIGGAHVKAVLVKAGKIVAVRQLSCPLWKGLGHLCSVMQVIMDELKEMDLLHAVTMTGELVDLFDNRDDGVKQIIQTISAELNGSKVLLFAGREGLVPLANVREHHYSSIASANWLASAALAAQKIANGLFLDCGSTTTDILLFKDGQVLAEGYTDYSRLLSKELVYTGIVRTAVMAVTRTAMDQGREIGLMAEYFATMADVYRVTGELNELHDQGDTADGAEKTLSASARRLSRMIGSDFDPGELSRWRQFAENIRGQQILQIQKGCQAQLSRHDLPPGSPLVGAGIGRFLIKRIASNLGRPYIDFDDLLPLAEMPSGWSAADCAPAAAVALLAGVAC